MLQEKGTSLYVIKDAAIHSLLLVWYMNTIDCVAIELVKVSASSLFFSSLCLLFPLVG